MKKLNKKSYDIKSAFIFGSSSELAIEICKKLAYKGCSKFHLLCRDLTKNNNLINYLNKNFDVSITQEKINLDKKYENYLNQPQIDLFDLYLFSTGYLSNMSKEKLIYDTCENLKIINTNFNSLIPWLITIDKILENTQSRLWVITSVAGDKGKPSNYQYGAAKAGLTIFCEGLLLNYSKFPKKIRIIKAGIIHTRMSKHLPNNFLKTNKSKFAKILVNSPNKTGIEYCPWWWDIIIKTISLLPINIIKKL